MQSMSKGVHANVREYREAWISILPRTLFTAIALRFLRRGGEERHVLENSGTSLKVLPLLFGKRKTGCFNLKRMGACLPSCPARQSLSFETDGGLLGSPFIPLVDAHGPVERRVSVCLPSVRGKNLEFLPRPFFAAIALRFLRRGGVARHVSSRLETTRKLPPLKFGKRG